MISVSQRGSCLEIQINRPERRNALTQQMYHDITAALRSAQRDAACSCVVISGAQGHFTAGNDLAEFKDFQADTSHAARDFLHALVDLDAPLIAAVEGQAVGVGVTLLLHCDYVYAGRRAQFRLPFTALGLCPEGGSSQLLAQVCGPRLASLWLLSGQPFDTEDALRGNLLTAITDDSLALPIARRQAEVLQALPVASLRLTKQLMRGPQREALHATIDEEWQHFVHRLQSDDAQAAFQRFFQKH